MQESASYSEYLEARRAMRRARRQAERAIERWAAGSVFETETRLLLVVQHGDAVPERVRAEAESILVGLYGGLLWSRLDVVPWQWMADCHQEGLLVLVTLLRHGRHADAVEVRRSVRGLAYEVWTELALSPGGPLGPECA